MQQALWPLVSQHISASTGEHFEASKCHPIGGGCINNAYLLEDGPHRYFIKTNDMRQAQLFAAEAVGLQAIIDSDAIRAPRPICHGTAAGQAYLVLEYIPLSEGTARTARALGERLAVLHKTTVARFGFDIDNAIGATPQVNTWCTEWISFYGTKRLRYQFELAAQNGLQLGDAGEQLIAGLPAFFTTYRPTPSLLHGDLWGGNWGSDEAGAPVIFDPACYYGDHEADLAMTELFGGFPAEFYAAYRANFTLDPGYQVRKQLYNLYHIVNHYNLFGGSYGAQAQRMLRQLNAEIM